MNFSAPFILRPIGTALLAVGLLLIGAVAYVSLPVASLPAIEFPTIRIMANRPGADPATMAASVAAPLERALSGIAGVTELTSSSSLGSASITVQFDLTRKIDAAARDVLAALNAAAVDLPADLPTLPIFKKVNPAAQPVLILALTSDTMPLTAVYDAADTVMLQRISQVPGVAEAVVAGAEQPAIRVRVDTAKIASLGISMEDVRNAIGSANTISPLGSLEGDGQTIAIDGRNQLTTTNDFRDIVVRAANGTVVRLADIATVRRGSKNTRAAGWFNRKPAILITVTKQASANVIQTVDAVRALLPQLNRFVPAGIDISVMTDRTVTIRASVADIQRTLAITVVLVMLVVFVFLRRLTPTLAAGITVPLSLAGTSAAIWLAGFTLDNLSLLAITVSVGFVVDDAIVMIENIQRGMDAGMSRMEAALAGARQIGFTVLSISLSLLAAFIPLLFMSGIIGKMFSEFSLTLTFAIVTSTAVSLTVTPMLCAHFMRSEKGRPPTLFDRVVEGVLSAMTGLYARSLTIGLRHPLVVVLVMVGTVAATVQMFKDIPKGFFPEDDTGLIFGFTNASADVSFPAMEKLQLSASALILKDKAVASIASFIGGSTQGSVNQGRLFISLKDAADRHETSGEVVSRLRKALTKIAGINVFMVPVQDLRIGGRQGKSKYQFTLWATALSDLETWTPKILERLRKEPRLVDVSSDREQGGLQANVVIDRTAASRLHVPIQSIDAALGDTFAQKQASNMYTQRNQYQVIIEGLPSRERDPNEIMQLHVPSTDGHMVPMTSFARLQRGSAPLVVAHQGVFPSATVNYDTAPGVPLEVANAALLGDIDQLHLPGGLHADFAGDARAAAANAGGEGVLILTALVAIYIILGVLYESLVHPVTIISTLPSAGLGALIALQVAGSELTVIAFIGIILLIGIVKKNGIMLVDFAVAAERERNATPYAAILEACLERFRPILMTTMAALLGAVPLVLAQGTGAELRRPLGITIVGGLLLSQVLTLYSTPVVYLLMARLQNFVRRIGRPRPAGYPQPAE